MDSISPFADVVAAKSLMGYLKRKINNLDRSLNNTQRAELVAFANLIETKVQPALEYSTWCENDAYSNFTRPAYGANHAFPLSYILPRSQRKAVLKAFASTDADTLYSDAAEALDALSNRLAANTAGGGFFFGQQQSSIDALLYSCLAYIKAAPVVHPQLRAKFNSHRPLSTYVDRISTEYFSTEVPAATEIDIKWSKWSGAAASQKDDKFNKQKNEKEVELNRKGRRWLFGAVAFMGAYVLLSGNYPNVSMLFLGELGEDDDGEEED